MLIRSTLNKISSGRYLLISTYCCWSKGRVLPLIASSFSKRGSSEEKDWNGGRTKSCSSSSLRQKVCQRRCCNCGGKPAPSRKRRMRLQNPFFWAEGGICDARAQTY